MKKLLKIGISALVILIAGAVFVFAGSPGDDQSSESQVQAKSAVHDKGSCSAFGGY